MKIDYIGLKSIYRILFFKLKIFIKNKFRRKNININIGTNVKIESNVLLRVGANSNISIGDNVYIGRDCRIECSSGASLLINNNVLLTGYDFIACMSSLEIGTNTIIGEFVSIRDNNHKYENIKKNIALQGYKKAAVVISDDVWVGRGCIILKGVSIGKHSVIGANSVVTKDIAPYSVAVGTPAKIIKKYDFKAKKWNILD